MPSIYALKPQFQNLLRPIARLLAAAGIRANHVTVFAAAASIAFSLFLILGPDSHVRFLAMPAFLFVRMALNAIDGMLAREFHQKSILGVYLNELGDVVSDAFLYLPFAFLPQFDVLWIFAFLVLAVISEMTGVVAVMAGASRRYDGPMGKSDRALAFGALSFWLGMQWPFSTTAAWWFPRLVTLLTALTIVNRVRKGLEETR
ncbi:MAG: CDP-alcohol phosphatidyltransferase family protein [Bryobacteraceae bacterium]